jgi:hypothetical protein
MQRFIFGLILVFISITAFGAPHTMRVDYFHTGNFDTEIFSLDQVVVEPLPFAGDIQVPIDRTLRGKYLFEVVDPESKTVLWSRSFSSIYGEWETTGEARTMHRTFHESIRFPAFEQKFDIVMKKRDAENFFQQVWRITIDPDDYLVHQESAAWADQVVPIEMHGDPAHKVDLLILGDGYTAAEHGAFVKRAKELTEVLFGTSPFKERRADFNVWAIAPATAISGVSRPSTRTYRDTPLGATYDAFRSERYLLTTDNKAMRRIASSAPYDFVEIITNTDTYGGGGIYGLYATVAANSEWANYVFVHEFGHHFAGLADEYYTSSVAYEAPEHVVEPYEPNVTAMLDPEKLKWRGLVSAETPLPTPWPKQAFDAEETAIQATRAQMRKDNVPESEMNALFRNEQQTIELMFSEAEYRDTVGAFEGANYQSTGMYRSQLNCIMFTRTTSFCKVCSDAIEAIIDQYTK